MLTDSNILIANIYYISEHNGIRPQTRLQTRHETFFSIWEEKNWHLPECCHLSWLEKSDVRQISQRAHPHATPLLLASSPQPADWACSHLHHVIWCSSLGPQQHNPHMDSKHFTVYLITIQIVPVLVWIRDFFLYVFSQCSPPGAYDLSMRLTALDQVGQPISVGITHQSGKQR